MMAQRKPLPKLHMPPYDLDEVSQANRDLTGSVVVFVDVREKWMASLSELLLLCNESANRRIKKFGIEKRVSDGTQTKPLGLEYIADRLDTDEPLSGYQVRTEDEGWLQGFITMTTFTVWQRNFRWDSHAPENGFTPESMAERKWDQDNALAHELDCQARSGNPDAEGIIWPRVAEVSLLGAIGCGSALLRLVIEKLEAGSQYDYLVVQATDNSVPFYEHFGFIRVGAVARYRDDKPNKTPGKRKADEEAELTLPDWILTKRIRFVLGPDKDNPAPLTPSLLPARPDAQSPPRFDGEKHGVAEVVESAERFVMQVHAEWTQVKPSQGDVARGFRVFSMHRQADGSERCKEWRSAMELGSCAVGAQRFLPNKYWPKLPGDSHLHPVKVAQKSEVIKKKLVAWIEIENEQEEVTAGYVKLLGDAASVPAKTKPAPETEAAETGGEEAEAAASGGAGEGAPVAGGGGVTGPETPRNRWSQERGTYIVPKHMQVDWNDHSEANVARRRAMGFVAYCHWTFPEQSVEDIHPSYMMARRLVHQEPPEGGAMQTLRGRMREEAPAVKRTHTHTAPDSFDRSTVQAIPTEMSERAIKNSMYNKVVTIVNNKEEFKYYYVLHYISDMDWCHLVPMHAPSAFAVTTPAVRNGRPRYKLVPEGRGRELDMPAARCRQVTAFTVSKTNDADREVWDVVEEHELDEYNRRLQDEKAAAAAARAKDDRPRGTGRPGRPPSQQPKKQDDPRPWLVSCLRIMKKTMKHRNAWPFCEPVDHVALGIPDYPDIVKHPMDMGTVRDKLQQDKYNDPKEWAEDMRLTFNNAMLYNPATDRVHKLAQEMKATFEEEVGLEGIRIKAKALGCPTLHTASREGAELKRSQKNLVKAAEGAPQIPTPTIPISSQWPEPEGDWRACTGPAADSVAGTSVTGSGDEMSVGSPQETMEEDVEGLSHFEASPVLR